MAHVQVRWCILLLILVVGCAGSPAPAPPPPSPVTDCTPSAIQQRWALATCAIITAMNDTNHQRLGGILLSDTEGVETATQILEEWWNIQSRQDLLNTLDWLAATGHRLRFAKDGAYLAGLNDTEFTNYLDRFGKTPAKRRKIIDIREGYQVFGDRSILAWDIGRYVAVAGWGYVAGYMTEAEAWKRIMPLVRQLQTAFGSWKEMGDNYLLGRRYWSRNTANDPARNAWEALLKDRNSPWSQLDWNADLKCPAP